jgi:hypothetical protein
VPSCLIHDYYYAFFGVLAAVALAWLWAVGVLRRVARGWNDWAVQNGFTYMIGAIIACVAILGNMEKLAILLFIPYIVDFFLKARSRMKAEEFAKIYNLDVVVIPTNRPLVRVNHNDVVFKSQREKLNAVADEIAELHKIGRPVLVGTTSIEKSEAVSSLLKKRGIPHQVLNAKPMYAEREAEVVAQAGRGGMGEVYRADDLRLGQTVALKFLPALRGRNPEDLAQHHREVRIARQISHPNVCRVFDIGDADGVLHLLPGQAEHPPSDDRRCVGHQRGMVPAALADARHADVAQPHGEVPPEQTWELESIFPSSQLWCHAGRCSSRSRWVLWNAR